MPLGTPAHFQSKDILTLSGDTLKKFSQEPKGLFESFKFEFISCVVTEILSARSNPRDSKDRSWVSRFAFISFFLDVSACQRSFSQKCHHRESYSGVDRYIFAYFIDFFSPADFPPRRVLQARHRKLAQREFLCVGSFCLRYARYIIAFTRPC